METNEFNKIEATGAKQVLNTIKGSILVKVATIIFLILILMIPASMIKGLVRERNDRYNETVQEISSKWGADQTISGPVLTVPYKQNNVTYSYSGKKRVRNVQTEIKYATFLPGEFVVNGDITPEVRSRGIYKALLYSSKIEMSGHFTFPDFSQWKIKDQDVMWNDAYLSLGITDLSGLKDNIAITFNGEKCEIESGTKQQKLIPSGVNSDVSIAVVDKNSIPFAISLDINGSRSLNVVPVGKKSSITMTSPWNSPSFTGSILPSKREVGEDGFNANWEIMHLSRSIPQQWLEDNNYFAYESVGVKMIFAVNEYQKIKRTSDYAILFILLTFVMFFIFELIFKVKVHPVQNLLIGTALTLFYALLLSLSEHLTFLQAYSIASVSIILLIGFYTKAIVKRYSLSFTVGGFISALYLYLYTVLQMEEFSLLIGSLGLFIMLAIIMYLTRNINFFEQSTEVTTDLKTIK